MKRTAGLFLLIIFFTAPPASAAEAGGSPPVAVRQVTPADQSLDGLSDWIPDRVINYSLVEQKIWGPDTVFDYLDGGAEIYLTYDFRGVLAVRYEGTGNSEIIFDLFDMGTSEEAFGVFSVKREGPPSDVGQGSSYTPGLLRFWKNRFYCSITATELTRDATNAVISLGRSIENLVAGVGRKPALLDLLPTKGLVEDTIRSFHSFMAFRGFYNLGWKDILHFDGKVDAALAEYSTGAGRSVLLAARYPDTGAAEQGAQGYLDYREEKAGTRLYPSRTHEMQSLSWEPPGEPGERWSSVEREVALLVIVLESPSREESERLVEAVLAKR